VSKARFNACGRKRPSPEHLASLTPLRGIAALWVVLFHYCWHFPAVHSDRYTIMRCLPEFLIGALLYSAYRGQVLGSVLATDTALLTAILLLCTTLHVAAPDFSIIPLFAVLLMTAVANQGRLGSLLNSAPLLWLGNISYSLYLIHWFVLFVTTEAMRAHPGTDIAKLPAGVSLALITAMLAVSVSFATLSYRFVEVAGRRWLRERLGVARHGARDLSAAGGQVA
jgi:peptidoglycan/LPS O-acetylase OafA/YrhL